MAPKVLDRAMDWTVVPGYSRVGYAVRRRFWKQDAAAGLDGSTVLVSGASSGIGAAACELFARGGADVRMLVRDRDKGEGVRDAIAARTGSERVRVEVCDLSSLASVREFAADFAAREPELHVLVNNA